MTNRSSTTEGTQGRFDDLDGDLRVDMIIGGETVPAETGETFRLFDPFEESEWAHVPEATASDVDRAVKAARAAFEPWAKTPVAMRSHILARWAVLLRENAEELARLQVHENGKTIIEMRGAVQGVAAVTDYAAQLIHTLHGATVAPLVPGHDAWTRKGPIGVVAAITPWNNPLALLSWKLVPAIAVGNTVVIKPSEVTPASTIRYVQLALEAGLPPGVINVVTGHGASGAALVNHPDVDKIAFTGSTGTGRAIAEAAGRRLARTTLELGGKGPQVVFPEADLDRAVASLVTGVIAGTGQACNAGSRLLVHDAIYDEVLERLLIGFGAVPIGDPLDEKTAVGPLASRAHFDRVKSYLEVAAQEGDTELLIGGRISTDVPGVETGLFVEPTLYATPNRTSRIRCEEIFGPVGALIRFKDEAEAVELANDTEFGLVSGVWTQDLDRARRMSEALRSGVVWVNTWRAFSPNVPFGGVKASGLGRELGLDMFDEYVETKAIWQGHGPVK